MACVAALPLALAPRSAGDIEIPHIILIVSFLIISLALHEFAHAWVAWKCGDSTAKDLGRLTLNPIPHIDPMMTIVIPGILLAMHSPFIFGGAKPVPVNVTRLRQPLRDMMLVAIAGPAMNLLIAIGLGFVLNLTWIQGWYPNAATNIVDRQEQLLPIVCWQTMVSNVMLAVFNMLPIPPLDGSRVMTWLLPPPLRAGYLRLESMGIILVLLFINLVPGVNHGISQATGVLVNWIQNFTGAHQ